MKFASILILSTIFVSPISGQVKATQSRTLTGRGVKNTAVLLPILNSYSDQRIKDVLFLNYDHLPYFDMGRSIPINKGMIGIFGEESRERCHPLQHKNHSDC